MWRAILSPTTLCKSIPAISRNYATNALFDKVLVANRGEIAIRVFKTCRKMGIKTVAVYSEPDYQAPFVEYADEAYCIGPAASAESYLKIENIIDVMKKTGAQAVHPGYGFLSENSRFVKRLTEENLTFIGPDTHAINIMGGKIASKQLAKDAGVSVIPGFIGAIESRKQLLEVANEIGYPVMVKASAGGGGKGMRIAWNDEDVVEGFKLSQEEARNSFGDDTMLIEKFVDKPRHIEIQVLADGKGNCVYLNERECSIQRRNQKVIEEAPSTFLTPEVRRAMGEQAVRLANAVDYKSAGTVEMLVDGDKNFYFLEMNTRLQVEHPVSEMITGVDIVEHMIRVAAGEPLALSQKDISINGWALESRIYAEDPLRNFLPSIGRLEQYEEPTSVLGDVRVDAGVQAGSEISMFYDPMISKLVTYAPNRSLAIEAMKTALDSYIIRGVEHNISLCRDILENPRFVAGDLTTNYIPEEYPDGFQGYQLSLVLLEEKARDLCAIAAMLRLTHMMQEYSVASIQPDEDMIVEQEFEITVNGETRSVAIFQADKEEENEAGTFIVAIDGSQVTVDFSLQSPYVFSAAIENEIYTTQIISQTTTEYVLQFMGTKFTVEVLKPIEKELAKYLPEKVVIDTSNLLLSPMPGKIISVNAKEGDKVLAGQELVTVEAMKMQNVLRAEKDAIVKSVLIKPNSEVAVDQHLMEFES